MKQDDNSRAAPSPKPGAAEGVEEDAPPPSHPNPTNAAKSDLPEDRYVCAISHEIMMCASCCGCCGCCAPVVDG